MHETMTAHGIIKAYDSSGDFDAVEIVTDTDDRSVNIIPLDTDDRIIVLHVSQVDQLIKYLKSAQKELQ